MTLDRSESTAIKGLLILLIVLGHNQLLLPHGSAGFMWFYLFHVTCFFILPFFYGGQAKKPTWRHISDLIVRTWWPYLITAIATWLVAGGEPGWNIVYAFLNGSSTLTGRDLGGTFLWFMPTFCSFSILHLLGRRYRVVKWIGGVVGLIVWSLSWAELEALKLHTLFGLPMALKYYAVGYICHELLVYSKWNQYVGAIIFALLSAGYLIFGIQLPYTTMLFPISAFGLLMVTVRCYQQPWLLMLGKHSLIIYLVHLFFYQGMLRWMEPTVWNGFLNLALTIGLSLMMAWGIEHFPILRKLYTPKNWGELITFYQSEK